MASFDSLRLQMKAYGEGIIVDRFPLVPLAKLRLSVATLTTIGAISFSDAHGDVPCIPDNAGWYGVE